MDRGTIDVASLTSRLTADSGQDAYVRALLRRGEGDWELSHASILVGAIPPNWVPQTWEYADIALVAHPVRAVDLPSLFLQAALGKGTLGALSFNVPAASGQTHWRHEPSYARLDRIPFNQPTTVFTVPCAVSDSSGWPSGMLVAESCPSFADINNAWRAFTENDYALTGAQSPRADLAIIRIAEHDAWLGPIHVGPTEMTVEIHGDAVNGAVLELNGATDRMDHRLDEPGTVTLPLTNGLPEDAWLWLKRGKQWLDYRSISLQSPWTGDLTRSGVEIEAPIDPQASVEALIAAGEGPRIEFKRQLVEYRKLKTVAAFAAGAGGKVVFGIDSDETTVVGLDGGSAQELRDRLGDLVRAAVTQLRNSTSSLSSSTRKPFWC